MKLEQAIENAETELRQHKTLAGIHEETAIVWLGRALAARRMRRDEWANDFAHEALEHASLTVNAGELVEFVQHELREAGWPWR